MSKLEIRLVTPMTIEEQVANYNATHTDSQMSYSEITADAWEDYLESVKPLLSEERWQYLRNKYPKLIVQ